MWLEKIRYTGLWPCVGDVPASVLGRAGDPKVQREIALELAEVLRETPPDMPEYTWFILLAGVLRQCGLLRKSFTAGGKKGAR